MTGWRRRAGSLGLGLLKLKLKSGRRSEGVKVADDVRKARSVLGDADVPIPVLLDFTVCHHLCQDLRCCHVVVALLLYARKLLLKLNDSLGLLKDLEASHLLLLVLVVDVNLLAPPLAPSFEQVGTTSLAC